LSNFVLYLLTSTRVEFSSPSYSFVSTQWIYFSGNFYLFYDRKIRKTLQKIKKIQAGRMKTKLRIAFENLVKLKSSKRNGSLKTREDIIVFKIVVFAKSFTLFLFFSAEIFALQRHSGAKKKKKFGSDC